MDWVPMTSLTLLLFFNGIFPLKPVMWTSRYVRSQEQEGFETIQTLQILTRICIQSQASCSYIATCSVCKYADWQCTVLSTEKEGIWTSVSHLSCSCTVTTVNLQQSQLQCLGLKKRKRRECHWRRRRPGCVAMSAVKQLLPRTKISLLLSSNTKSNSNC